jgi:hypothetical protein
VYAVLRAGEYVEGGILVFPGGPYDEPAPYRALVRLYVEAPGRKGLDAGDVYARSYGQLEVCGYALEIYPVALPVRVLRLEYIARGRVRHDSVQV